MTCASGRRGRGAEHGYYACATCEYGCGQSGSRISLSAGWGIIHTRQKLRRRNAAYT
jgi:hypothetical protein